MFELHAAELAISDDMLLCRHALRWVQSDLLPAGDRQRIRGGKGGDRAVGPEVARGAVTTGRIGD